MIFFKKEPIFLIKQILTDEEVVILPTDTIYGIMCLSSSDKAIHKIFKIKKRKPEKPLQLLVKNATSYLEKVKMSKRMREKLYNLPFTKTTFIFKNTEELSKNLGDYFKKLRTLGIRETSHSLLRKIIEILDIPLAATSANISDEDYDEDKIIETFFDSVPLILIEGKKYNSYPSAVIEIVSETNIIIRRSNPILEHFKPFLKEFLIEE